MYCRDEVSTGLDSAVTFDITAALRSWAVVTKGILVASLLQVTNLLVLDSSTNTG
jgi:hypothetical protein